MEQFSVESRVLDATRRRELEAYRRIGSVREFRRLKREELRRRDRRILINRILDHLLAFAFLIFTIVGILFFLTVMA